MVKIVHVSDIHIGASLKSSSYAKEFALLRQREIKETFFQVVEYCNKTDIDILIISGDMFDSESVKKSDIDNIVYKLKNCKAKTYIITGNHDPLIDGSYWNYFKGLDNIHLFGPEIESVVFDDNVVVYGHSWDKYHISESIFDSIKINDKDKVNILIGHGEVGNKTSTYLPISKEKLSKIGFDYVALGHIHKHEFITDRIAYAGSLEPFDFSEQGKHGFIEIHLSKKEIKKSFIPFAKREFIITEIELTGEMTESEIHEKISNLSEDTNLHRVVFKGRYNHNINLDESYLHELFKIDFFYLEFRNKAAFDFDISQLKKENKGNIIHKYIEKFESMNLDDEIVKNAFFIGLEQLLIEKEGAK